MTGRTPTDIFISYRRDDAGAAHAAPRVAEDLRRLLKARVFMDIDTLDPGVDFEKAIKDAVSRCGVLIAVIGKEWLDARDAAGRRRLDLPGDWVRLEIGTALARGIRVVPALLDKTAMPKAEELPDNLKTLATRQAIELRLTAFDRDVEFLADVLGRETGGGRLRWFGPAIAATQTATPEITAMMVGIEAPIVFGCGRKKQWGDLTTLAATRLSEAIFVVGPQRQAHDFFLERVHNCLPKDPSRRIVSVRWDPPYTPVGRGGYLAALRNAFGCTSDEALIGELKAHREDQNLVLVHRPVAQDAFDREDLVLYYTKWLPALLKEPPGPAGRLGGVKAIQAVAWQKASLLASLQNLFGRRTSSSYEGLAQDLLNELGRRQDSELPIRLLDELEDLEDQEIVDWSKLLPSHFDRSRILDQVLGSGKDAESRLTTITQLIAAHWRHTDER